MEVTSSLKLSLIMLLRVHAKMRFYTPRFGILALLWKGTVKLFLFNAP